MRRRYCDARYRHDKITHPEASLTSHAVCGPSRNNVESKANTSRLHSE